MFMRGHGLGDLIRSRPHAALLSRLLRDSVRVGHSVYPSHHSKPTIMPSLVTSSVWGSNSAIPEAVYRCDVG